MTDEVSKSVEYDRGYEFAIQKAGEENATNPILNEEPTDDWTRGFQDGWNDGIKNNCKSG